MNDDCGRAPAVACTGQGGPTRALAGEGEDLQCQAESESVPKRPRRVHRLLTYSHPHSAARHPLLLLAPHPFLSPVPTSTVNMSWSGCAHTTHPPHPSLTTPQIQEVYEQGGHNRTLPAPPPSPSPTPTPRLITTLLPPLDPAKDRPDRAHGRPGLRHRGGEVQAVRPASSHSRRTLPLRYPCRRSRSPASLRA